jgi:hypothetical protein
MIMIPFEMYSRLDEGCARLVIMFKSIELETEIRSIERIHVKGSKATHMLCFGYYGLTIGDASRKVYV